MVLKLTTQKPAQLSYVQDILANMTGTFGFYNESLASVEAGDTFDNAMVDIFLGNCTEEAFQKVEDFYLKKYGNKPYSKLVTRGKNTGLHFSKSRILCKRCLEKVFIIPRREFFMDKILRDKKRLSFLLFRIYYVYIDFICTIIQVFYYSLCDYNALPPEFIGLKTILIYLQMMRR